MQRRLTLRDWHWTRDLAILAGAVFMLNVAIGLSDAVRTNFFVDGLGMSGEQILWLEGLREIPGLALVFIAAAMMALPPRMRAVGAMVVMAVGYALYLTVPSFAILVPVEILASLGLHVWMPLLTILGTALVPRNRTGSVLGLLGGAAALAVITGMGGAAALSRIGGGLPLRGYYVIGAVLLALAAGLLVLLPRGLGETVERPQRILLRRRYWVYYLLTFMQGERKQVLHSFGTLVLVSQFGWEVWQISTLLLISAVVNMVASPAIGRALDRYGERTILSASYAAIALSCVAFATISQIWALAVVFILIRLLVLFGIGVDSWVSRLAPREELAPTLAAGISINHVSSVGMPLLAGLLLPLIQYEGIFLMTAALTVASAVVLHVPAAREAMRGVALAKSSQVAFELDDAAEGFSAAPDV
jgi:predicted MFS family arabinose efflux permease